MDIGSISLRNQVAAFEERTSGGSAKAAKVEDAAQQFEALLLAELLRASRGGDSGWLGTGEDSSMSSAMELAQEYLARVMAAQGGIGITRYVSERLANAPE